MRVTLTTDDNVTLIDLSGDGSSLWLGPAAAVPSTRADRTQHAATLYARGSAGARRAMLASLRGVLWQAEQWVTMPQPPNYIWLYWHEDGEPAKRALLYGGDVAFSDGPLGYVTQATSVTAGEVVFERGPWESAEPVVLLLTTVSAVGAMAATSVLPALGDAAGRIARLDMVHGPIVTADVSRFAIGIRSLNYGGADFNPNFTLGGTARTVNNTNTFHADWVANIGVLYPTADPLHWFGDYILYAHGTLATSTGSPTFISDIKTSMATYASDGQSYTAPQYTAKGADLVQNYGQYSIPTNPATRYRYGATTTHIDDLNIETRIRYSGTATGATYALTDYILLPSERRVSFTLPTASQLPFAIRTDPRGNVSASYDFGSAAPIQAADVADWSYPAGGGVAAYTPFVNYTGANPVTLTLTMTIYPRWHTYRV